MIRFILMDIEGTTTSIAFVHEVLFPYASKHLASFIQENTATEEVQKALEAVKVTVAEENGVSIDEQQAISSLHQWIKEDRKHTALKSLQGFLWKTAYESGDYQGHIYPDVVPEWKKWKAKGLDLGIYSSGSVEAQKLLFGYSEEGDLRSYLSAYFDTTTGHKREAASYQKIAAALEYKPQEILFLSDVEAELDAAKEAGMSVVQLVRPGTPPSVNHMQVSRFDEIELA